MAVISDVTTVIVWGCHKPCPYKMLNLINVVCVLTTPLTSHFPVSLPLFGPLYYLRQDSLKIRPVSKLTMASKCSSERTSHIPLILNQKLEMTKFSEEGMLNAEMS